MSWSNSKLLERIALALLAVGACIGSWHALPLVNVVADEQYYVGGVLRALAAGSLLPLAGDVPYGTLTFYLNYLFQLPLLAGLLAVLGGKISVLKEFLILSPEIAYIVPRVVSAAIAIGMAWFLNRFLREEGVSLSARAAALSALFMTVLPAVIFHTGKMWVLSFSAVTVSVLYAYRALARARSDERAAGRASFFSLIAAAIATANVPFAGIAFLSAPLLLYRFWHSRTLLLWFFYGSIASALIVVAVLALNGGNILGLVALVFSDYQPAAAAAHLRLPFFESLGFHAYQLFVAFPLVLALIVLGIIFRAIRNHTLFFLGALFTVAYLLFITVFAAWYDDPGLYLRYMFPFGFFLALILASFSYDRLRVPLCIFLAMQLILYAHLLALLSAPTTYNVARDHITKHFSGERALIYENVVELDLPQNQATALALKDEFCGSTCQYMRVHTRASFTPVTESVQSAAGTLDPATFVHRYVITAGDEAVCAGMPIASFTGGGTDEVPLSIERNLGSYFLLEFWIRERLGANLHMYAVSSACYEEIRDAAR